MTKPLISFDYAIKYILKSKQDYDIIEGFISALFATEGYKPIKIKSLLDPESNKEAAHLKKSIADLVVEDEDHNTYIVEIERSHTPHYTHKSCFNTSRLIVDSITENQSYTRIQKVFHISLLYFAPSEMKSPIYHGKTLIHAIDSSHPPSSCLRIDHSKICIEPTIYPEYFFISVPLFDDLVRAEIDEWLYVMKHEDVKEDFKSPYMKRVMDRLTVLKMNDTDRTVYFKYLKEMVNAQDAMDFAIKQGIEKGLEEGLMKGLEVGREEGIEKGIEIGIEKGIEKGAYAKAVAIAKSLKASRIDFATIHTATGLSVEEIERV